MLLVWAILGCGRTNVAIEAPAPAPSGCAAQDPATWEACVGQPVTVAATRAKIVPSAPLLNGPGQHQDYFEVAGRSLIVLSAAPIACDAADLAGTLRVEDLGGPEGTPMSWRGFVFDATTVSCR